jgi:hypothetical protein
VNRFERLLRRIKRDLDALGARWVFVGGVAVSTLAYSRFTNDVDVVVAVAEDAEAERLVHSMTLRGYEPGPQFKRDDGRLATVRLICPPDDGIQVVLDLLFANTGIEDVIVRDAQIINVYPTFLAPVATVGHLVAMKLVAVRPGREHDERDLIELLDGIGPEELARARAAIAAITASGSAVGRDLSAMLDDYLARVSQLDR